MLKCNILIIVRVLKTRIEKKRGMYSVNSNNRTKISAMTAMLLTVTFTFIVLTTPVAVNLAGQFLWWKETITASLENYAKFKVFWAVANLLMYMNNAINFVLYVLIGPRFRKEFCNIFMCHCCHGQVQVLDLSYKIFLVFTTTITLHPPETLFLPWRGITMSHGLGKG